MTRTHFRPDQVDPSAFIAPTAVVIGDVSLGQESSVWYGAVLRGDTEAIRVGRGSNIQDGCVVHADPGFPCTIGDGVTVGHLAIVHGATVGNNVTIGMHSTVMNGAVIGDNCIVGAGAVVTEGTQIPAGSLVVGLPGKIRRELTAAEIEHNRLAAAHYVQNSRAFMRAGTSE
ncbi:MAG: gamma carbonic anhydrase family protein [Pirellulales bacterium]